jgi:uncharacterized membrane protein
MGSRRCPRVDPRWHPTVLTVLGAIITLTAYFTSTHYPLYAVAIGMIVGGLTLAAGITLAFINTFRRPRDTTPPQPWTWRRR